MYHIYISLFQQTPNPPAISPAGCFPATAGPAGWRSDPPGLSWPSPKHCSGTGRTRRLRRCCRSSSRTWRTEDEAWRGQGFLSGCFRAIWYTSYVYMYIMCVPNIYIYIYIHPADAPPLQALAGALLRRLRRAAVGEGLLGGETLGATCVKAGCLPWRGQIWLVVEPYPYEKYESIGMMTFPTVWKNKKCSKPPTRDGSTVPCKALFDGDVPLQ